MKRLLLLLAVILIASAFTSQLFNTKLQVTVTDTNGTVVKDVEVILYRSNSDHTKQKNRLQSGTTNNKGIVSFKKLETKRYYLHAKKGPLDNTLGDYETAEMHKGKINKITLTIE